MLVCPRRHIGAAYMSNHLPLRLVEAMIFIELCPARVVKHAVRPSPKATGSLLSATLFPRNVLHNNFTHSQTSSLLSFSQVKKDGERWMPEAGGGGGWGSKALSAHLTCEHVHMFAHTLGRPTARGQVAGGADRCPCAQGYFHGRGNSWIRAYFLSIQHQKSTLHRFVVVSSPLICTRLLWSLSSYYWCQLS